MNHFRQPRAPSYTPEGMNTRFSLEGIPPPEYEWQFLKNRKFRADMAWPEYKILLEVDGGTFGGRPCPLCKMRPGGRHNSGAGFLKDIEKFNLAIAAGFRPLRCTPQDLQKSKIYSLIRALMVTPKE